MSELQDTYLRLPQIIGDRKAGIPGLLPISRSHFYRLVADGDLPKPMKLGIKTTVWREADIRQAIEKLIERSK